MKKFKSIISSGDMWKLRLNHLVIQKSMSVFLEDSSIKGDVKIKLDFQKFQKIKMAMDMNSSEESFEEEGLFLLDTAQENSRSFAESFSKNKSVEGFLKRDDYLSARATAIQQGVDQEELRHKSDIDGVTIEWIGIAKGLKSEFRHFEIVPPGVWSLRRFYPVIKKHNY